MSNILHSRATEIAWVIEELIATARQLYGKAIKGAKLGYSPE